MLAENLGTGGIEIKNRRCKEQALSLGVSVFIGTGRGQEKFVDVLKGKGDGTYGGSAPQKEMKMQQAMDCLTFACSRGLN